MTPRPRLSDDLLGLRTFSVLNPSRRIMMAHLVHEGAPYGRTNSLTNTDGQPLIEFYDASVQFNDRTQGLRIGQFVSRYHLDTFLDHKGGLCLDGNVPIWSLSKRNMRDFKDWLAAVSVLEGWSRT